MVLRWSALRPENNRFSRTQLLSVLPEGSFVNCAESWETGANAGVVAD